MKVLVLGDGLLGGEISKQTNWDVLSRNQSGLDVNIASTYFALTDYDVVVNCIANTDTYSINKESHWNVNYKFVDNLIDICNQSKTKLVQISSDYVYAGSVDNASEVDVPVHCNNWYGYTKLLSDGLVQLRAKDYLVCRCTHKPYPFPYDAAWDDQIGNFDYVDKIASLIIDLIKTGASGLYNVGTETKSMFELAIETRDVTASKTPEHVPKNQSMSIVKMKKTLNET
tara:strand:+ start:1782 stop:2465 length:684 start_codon:yes stop_codon:yes gene_type:complete